MYFVRKIKLLIRFYFSCFCGLIKFDFQKNKLLIFNYHNFNNSNKIDDEMYVSHENFKEQLIYFKKNNLLISYNDLLKRKYNFDNKKILLTIDDADFSIKNIIVTITKLKIPVILFLPIGLLLNHNDINYYRSICLHHYFSSNLHNDLLKNKEAFFNKILKHNISDLKKITKDLSKKNINKDYVISRKKITYSFLKNLSKIPYITLGSHSMSHVKLSKIPNKWLEWEIAMSLKYIKKLKGRTEIYSLPYGNYDSFSDNVINLLSSYKIKHIFSTIGFTNNSDKALFGRTFVLNSKKILYLYGMINGSMNLFDKILFRVKNNNIKNTKNQSDDIYPLW